MANSQDLALPGKTRASAKSTKREIASSLTRKKIETPVKTNRAQAVLLVQAKVEAKENVKENPSLQHEVQKIRKRLPATFIFDVGVKRVTIATLHTIQKTLNSSRQKQGRIFGRAGSLP